jgi:prevent-host-death family protein
MKTVSAEEATRSFSELLGDVGKGETYLITSSGRAVAHLVPVGDDEARQIRERAIKELFDDLRALPVRNLPRVTRDEIYDYLDE